MDVWNLLTILDGFASKLPRKVCNTTIHWVLFAHTQATIVISENGLFPLFRWIIKLIVNIVLVMLQRPMNTIYTKHNIWTVAYAYPNISTVWIRIIIIIHYLCAFTAIWFYASRKLRLCLREICVKKPHFERFIGVLNAAFYLEKCSHTMPILI